MTYFQHLNCLKYSNSSPELTLLPRVKNGIKFFKLFLRPLRSLKKFTYFLFLQPETVQNRLFLYNEMTRPLLDYYK